MKACIKAAFGLLLLLTLCACSSYEAKVAGTWQGDGTLDVGIKEPVPFEGAERWVFDGESTVIATVYGRELKFHYYASDDTLTLNNGGEESWGVQYELKGDTLRIAGAEFTKVK